MTRRGWLLAALLSLSGCSEDPGIAVPAQRWKDMEIRVETRPPMPQPGMNEFLIIATLGRNRPGFDLLVSIRTRDGDPWRQAIQDGRTGVYRRALAIGDPATARLTVLLKQKGEETILEFPLQAAAPTG